MSRLASTAVAINAVLAERWSPRAFDNTFKLTVDDITPIFEAARWAPSANNMQPWRYIVGFRGDQVFDTIVKSLAGWNTAWAPNASVLATTVAHTENDEGQANPFALFDLGQSVAHLSIQAQTQGLYVHQMAGTDADFLRRSFNLPAGFSVFHTFAIGKIASPDTLPPELADRERAPRVRHDLSEIVRYSAF